ncbi:MAG: hypothetical protein AB8F26_09065 [Phycisphaerales bacterium]
MTIFDRITDARGARWKPCEIKKVSKQTGIDRFLLAPPARRADMFRVAIFSGMYFGVGMAVSLILKELIITGQVDRLMIRLTLLMAPIGGLLSGVFFGFFASGYIWKSTTDARDAMLEYDLCPHCAHGIGSIPSEPDGCTVCPECGAAWRFTSMSPDPAVAAARQRPEVASSRRV